MFQGSIRHIFTDQKGTFSFFMVENSTFHDSKQHMFYGSMRQILRLQCGIFVLRVNMTDDSCYKTARISRFKRTHVSWLKAAYVLRLNKTLFLVQSSTSVMVQNSTCAVLNRETCAVLNHDTCAALNLEKCFI